MEYLKSLLSNLKTDLGCSNRFELKDAADNAGYIEAALDDGYTQAEIDLAIKSCFAR